MSAPLMYFKPGAALPATYRLPTGAVCDVHDHDLTPVGFRLFLSALANAIAFTCSRAPEPDAMVEYFNHDPSLLSGWYVIRTMDKELSCTIFEYDVGTYSRFCLDHQYLYIVWRRHDPSSEPAPAPSPPSDQDVSDNDDDLPSVDSLRADEEEVAARSPKGKRRVAMRWTATDLDNLRAGVAQFGKDWHAILSTYDFRGRNTRALSERWHRLTATEIVTDDAKMEDGGGDENAAAVNEPSQTRRGSVSVMRGRAKRGGGGRSRRASAPETGDGGDRSHICATQRFYTEKEEQNLREGVARFGQDWPRILAEYWGDNPDRSTKSLAKKWRVLSGVVDVETDDKASDVNPDEAVQEEFKRRRRSGSTGGEPVSSPAIDPIDEPFSSSAISAAKRTRRSSAI